MGNRKQPKKDDAFTSYTNTAQIHETPTDTESSDMDGLLEESLETQCREHVCPHCVTQAEADDIRLRAFAEMDNYKKRLGREWEEKSKYMTEAVLADLLPALDSLDLAILYGSREEACQNMLTGITMTRKMLFDALKNHGLTSVGEMGELFDPEQHEAVAQEIRDDIESGHICAVMQRGYYLKGRLLRPAKVSVATNETK